MRFIDQARAVVPLAIYLVLFQLLILRQGVDGAWIIGAGLFSVIVGLMLFMEGLKQGLMPLGESLGNGLPSKSSLPVVLTIAFLLGISVTFAEPAIGALKQAGQLVDLYKAPYLYALLNQWSEVLVLVVGTGVGLAVVLGTLRFLYGWSRLGGQSGALIPGAFMSMEGFSGSPLYSYQLGVLIALAFAWILGFGATLAEPALNALGLTVENLTNGAFKKSMLMYAVSLGVGCGIALGVLKIVYDIPVAYLIVPGYLVAIVLTIFSTEEFVNVAWDSAGVTTGPVTVPLVLAMGLGFGSALGVTEGFGILSMASIGPIIAVQATGLWIRYKIKRRHDDAQETGLLTGSAGVESVG